jgi:predicted nuclease with TOPRIM domain
MIDERSIANKLMMEIDGIHISSETRNKIQSIIEGLTLPLRRKIEDLENERNTHEDWCRDMRAELHNTSEVLDKIKGQNSQLRQKFHAEIAHHCLELERIDLAIWCSNMQKALEHVERVAVESGNPVWFCVIDEIRAALGKKWDGDKLQWVYKR